MTLIIFETLSKVGKDVAEGVGDDGNVWFLLYCCFSVCTTCLVCGQRGTVRNKYNIQGDSMSDCLISWFCTICALTQLKREVDCA